MNEKGLSLLEILISVMILAVIMTGLANIFVASKRHILHSRSRIQSAELGRLFLAPLQMDINQNTWDESPVDPLPNNLLTLGNYRSTNNPFPPYSGYTVVSWLGEPNPDGIIYYPVYEITDVSGTTLRRATLTITWNEPSP